MLRRVFAQLALESGWSTIAQNDAARAAVMAFVEESRRREKPNYEVIMAALSLTGAWPSQVGESERDTIVRWVIEAL